MTLYECVIDDDPYPMVVVFQRDYTLAVGETITVRKPDEEHGWFEVKITKVHANGLFEADRV